MSRFTVMGFTEAELGFVLAGLFAALAGARVTLNNKIAVKAAADSTELALARRKIDSLQTELAKRPKMPENKISTITPLCWEKGEPDVPIGSVVIIGSNNYLLNGQTVDIAAIEQRFAKEISRSTTLECRYPLVVTSTAETSALQYQAGARRLRKWFYLRG